MPTQNVPGLDEDVPARMRTGSQHGVGCPELGCRGVTTVVDRSDRQRLTGMRNLNAVCSPTRDGDRATDAIGARQHPRLSIDRDPERIAEIDEAHRHGTQAAC